ncbi:MAG: acyltransferase [Chroococcidiopsidaceae cyanobacterium CP_BM_RX_35]|nr:acyltransferase [Chroococcidiopsidaceae cyanobacterium CP_BM_RX_35]
MAILTGCAIALWIFVAMLWHDKKDWLVRLLSWAPLAYIGKLSYGIYVYHLLAQHLTWNVLLYQINNWSHYPKMGLRLIVYGVLSVAIAAFSYHFYEKPFLQLKKQLR